MIDNCILFDARIAEKYSLEEAIVIHKIYGWIKHNAVNGKNYHNGRYWTFNSLSAFAKYFPFWSESKIKRILIDLYGGSDKKEIEPKHEQLLLKGNFNKSSFDRTVWYSFTDDFFNFLSSLGYTLCADIPQEENQLSESDQMDIPLSETPFSESDQMDIPPADKQYQQPIQVDNKKTKEKGTSVPSKKAKNDFLSGLISLGVEEQVAIDWMNIRAGAKKASNSSTAFKQLETALNKILQTYGISHNDAIRVCVTNGWYGCKESYFSNIRLSDYNISPVGQASLFDANTNQKTEWE